MKTITWEDISPKIISLGLGKIAAEVSLSGPNFPKNSSIYYNKKTSWIIGKDAKVVSFNSLVKGSYVVTINGLSGMYSTYLNIEKNNTEIELHISLDSSKEQLKLEVLDSTDIELLRIKSEIRNFLSEE